MSPLENAVARDGCFIVASNGDMEAEPLRMWVWASNGWQFPAEGKVCMEVLRERRAGAL